MCGIPGQANNFDASLSNECSLFVQLLLKAVRKKDGEEGPLVAASSYLLLAPAFQFWLQTCTVKRKDLPFTGPTVPRKPFGLTLC